MKAFLLAAGQGKRFYPFTKELPKPLYKVLGKPLIEWNVEKLQEAGYTDLIINIHHLGNKIVDYLDILPSWKQSHLLQIFRGSR